jgi:hypothetical protein
LGLIKEKDTLTKASNIRALLDSCWTGLHKRRSPSQPEISRGCSAGVTIQKQWRTRKLLEERRRRREELQYLGELTPSV